MDSNLFKKHIEEVTDFPLKGVNYKDVTSLFLNAKIWKCVIDQMVLELNKLEYDAIVGPESRSFMFLGALSYQVNKPFVIFRKKGKLPRKTINIKYELEYGTSQLFVHEEDILKYKKVVIIDDLLATGGTLKAMNELLEQHGIEVVKNLFLIEICDLKGREVLKNNTTSLIKY